MYVCLSPGGPSLTVSERAQDKLLVGTVDGVFSFLKRNGAWEHQGTLLPGRHISAILHEPASGMLLAGTYSCEIFASADSGQTWEN